MGGGGQSVLTCMEHMCAGWRAQMTALPAHATRAWMPRQLAMDHAHAFIMQSRMQLCRCDRIDVLSACSRACMHVCQYAC
eukprot:362944-Chlamydomonas_euryale.AAC.5